MGIFLDILGIILNIIIFLLKLFVKFCIGLFWLAAMTLCIDCLFFLVLFVPVGIFFPGIRHWLFETSIPGVARAIASCFKKMFGIEGSAPQILKKDGTPDMRYLINRNR